jgi:hypothetical protein
MPILPVQYYDANGFREGGYVWVFKVVGAGAESWNRNNSDNIHWRLQDLGSHHRRVRFFAGLDYYWYRSDCARVARRFSREHGVRTILLCLPLPVRGGADYYLTVVRVREHRRAVTIRWMLGAGYSLEVAECIAEFLVGRKLTKLSYSTWLRFN